MTKVELIAALLFFVLMTVEVPADPPPWNFDIPHQGRVLFEGGWFQEYNLGEINVSPEFHFPLQLVYLSTRETVGMFGPQWFCPQLESTVIPQGIGGFIWQTPAGNVVPFRKSTIDTSLYADPSGKWMAKATEAYQEIWNEEGWTLDYERGHLKSIKSPTSRALHFSWNGDILQSVQFVDLAGGGQTVIIQSDSQNSHTISNLDFNGVSHQFAYDYTVFSRLLSWTDPTHKRLYFAYADQGILAQVQPDKGQGDIQTFYTTIRDTNLISSDQKDPANWWLIEDPDNKYTYFATGHKGAVLTAGKFTATSKMGSTVSVDYNPAGGVFVESTPDGSTKTTTYFRAPGKIFDGKMKSVEVDGIVKIEYEYNPKTGLLASITDENGIATYFDYPPDWRRTPKNPWDPKPIRIWRGTPQNPQIIQEAQYDAAGRPTTVTDAAGQVTTVNYTSRGEIGSVTGPDGMTTALAYDAFGRCVQASLGDQTTSVEYDDQGRIVSRTEPDGTKMAFTYDEMGNLVQTLRNGKPLVDYLRDATGKITGKKDALGRVHRIDSDSNGNVLAEYAPDGSVTKYEYDKFNRRTAQIDGNGNKVSFTYDGASHIVKQVNALGDTLKWDYDNENRLTAKDNGIQHITYEYDDNGRMTSTDYGAGQLLNCSYDDHGRVISMVTPDTAFYYIYNSLGQIDALRVLCGSDEQLLRFRYDYAGNRTGLILARLDAAIAPAGGKIGQDAHYELLQQTEYNYDQRRLVSIVSNGRTVVSYKYDSGGRVIAKTFGNGMIASLSYDAAGRLASMIFAGGPIPAPLTLSYQWDDADQVVRRSWAGEVQRYQYDLAGRLAKVFDDQTGKEVESYGYDKAGNIIEKTIDGEKTVMVYNAANELVSSTGPDGTHAYTYDKAGRLMGPPKKIYGWLDKVVQTVSPTGAPIALTYWPDGQLAAEGPAGAKDISKVAYQPQSGGETFLWDGLALLRRNDVIYIAEPHPSGGVAVASHPIGSNENTYYINDLLGTTLAVVKGGAIEYNHLTSFGQMRKNNLTSFQPRPISPVIVVPAVTPPQPQLPPSSN